MSVKLCYFAWVRERIGKPDEVVEPPAEVRTIAELLGWLAGRGDEYAHAFENPKVIRAAIDRAHVRRDAPLAGAREIAFFAPMTGGGCRQFVCSAKTSMPAPRSQSSRAGVPTSVRLCALPVSAAATASRR